MSADTVPSAAFESLLPKMITILQTAQNPEGVVSPEVKRALLHAINDLKDNLTRAQDLANSLPGGEVTVEEQDEVIAMLEGMRESKQRQLEEFASRASVVVQPAQSPAQEETMEVDSAASTPS